MGEFLGYENAIQGVIDAAGGAQTQHVPIAEQSRVAARNDKYARLGNLAPGKHPRRAIFVDDAAGMNVVGMQKSAAIVPMPGEAKSLALYVRATERSSLTGNDRRL